MKSVRLDPELEACLAEAARITGRPASAIIREAVRARCQELLGERLSHRLRDVIGTAPGIGGNSRKTGRDFTALLQRKRKPRR